MRNKSNEFIFRFNREISDHEWPASLNHPLSHETPSLCIEAADILKNYIDSLPSDLPLFNQTTTSKAYGKMFGVLLIEDLQGNKGFIAAFSGRLGNTNLVDGFVPPVFNLLDENGFFRKGEHEITSINKAIMELENAAEFIAISNELNHIQKIASEQIGRAKNDFNDKKNRRHQIRKQINPELTESETIRILKELEKESRQSHRIYKETVAVWQNKVKQVEDQFRLAETPIKMLKQKRKIRSAELQEKLFTEYAFLNRDGEWKNLKSIFASEPVGYPPSGAGECCAPRLFQHAFLKGYKPVAIAEFWWGDSPITEIRHHGQFYPACKGKCAPILKHMLKGIEIKLQPKSKFENKSIYPEILYEDDWFLAIHKHENMLSVPGKIHEESILQILRKVNSDWSEIIAAHRLDMATSGILLFAKNMEVYKAIQQLFISRNVFKRYVALIEKTPAKLAGTIDLPIKSDYYNRPRQMVCYSDGKPAITKFEVIAQKETHTRIHFFPLTGRTHQLRVHAAHSRGLNSPILGDDLYGKSADRLYLHAELMEFVHPFTGKSIKIERPADF